MIFFWILALLVCFYLLAKVTDGYFVPALEIIGERLKFSPDMAGATLMAVGSSAPELAISILALVRHGGESESIGSGTIIGSALFNILVIIGISSIVRRAILNWQPVVRDNAFYFLSVCWLLISFWDGQVVLHEALVFVLLYGVYLVAVVKWRDWFPFEEHVPEMPPEIAAEENDDSRLWRRFDTWVSRFMPEVKHVGAAFGLSILAICILSYALVESAVELAHILNIPPAIVALTILAAGTSVPDLLSSVIVARKGQGGMAISNAVGSNIFDILIGLGLPWTVLLLVSGEPVPVDTNNLLGSVALLLATIVATFFIYQMSRWKVGKRGGWVLVGCYVLYLGYAISQAMS